MRSYRERDVERERKRERVTAKQRCVAGECIVLVNADHCVASQSVAQWVRLSGARAKDEGQRARRER